MNIYLRFTDIKTNLKLFILLFTYFKGTVLIDPPWKEGNDRLTTVPWKPLCVPRVRRYVCVNVSKPSLCSAVNYGVPCVQKIFEPHTFNSVSQKFNFEHTTFIAWLYKVELLYKTWPNGLCCGVQSEKVLSWWN